MTRTQFLSGLGQAINWDGELTEVSILRDHELWDSTGMLSAIVFIDEQFGVTVATASLEAVTSGADIADLVAEHLT